MKLWQSCYKYLLPSAKLNQGEVWPRFEVCWSSCFCCWSELPLFVENTSYLCRKEYSQSGPHNKWSFLAVNSTQNYFLIARMLSFQYFATKWDNFLYRKWIEREEIQRKWGISHHFLILSPFPLHFLIISPFPLHFLIISSFPHYLSISSSFSLSLSIFSQPGFQAATIWATLFTNYFDQFPSRIQIS